MGYTPSGNGDGILQNSPTLKLVWSSGAGTFNSLTLTNSNRFACGEQSNSACRSHFHNPYGSKVLLTKLRSGNRLVGVHGGTGADFGCSICPSPGGDFYFAGSTQSNSGINTAGAHQTAYGGGRDAFLGKIKICTLSAQINPNANPVTLCPGGNVALSASITGATGAVTYLWTGNITTPTLTVNTPGTYGLVVRDAGGCVSQVSKIVQTPTLTVNNNSPICLYDAVQLTATSPGATSFQWTGPGNYTSNQQNPQIFNPSPGTYTVVVQNRGCTLTASQAVTYHPNAWNNIWVGPAYPFYPCELGDITISMDSVYYGPGTTYLLTGPNGVHSTYASTTFHNISMTYSGQYVLVVTSSAGCSMSYTMNISVRPAPVISITSNSPVCPGATLSLAANGGFLNSWSGPNGFTSNAYNPVIANVSAASSGNYSVTVTNTNGCTATATTNVVVNPFPNATASHNTVSERDPFLHASGGTTTVGPAQWLTSLCKSHHSQFTNINVGTYFVAVTGANGCISTASTTVIINPLPVATATLTSPVCRYTYLNLAATGGSSYHWAGPCGFQSNVQNPTTYANSQVCSGNFSVTVTDNGCSSVASTYVTVHPQMGIYIPSQTFCEGGSLTLSDTYPNVYYSWAGPNGFTQQSSSNSVHIANATALNAGNYTVTITNSYGCSGVAGTTAALRSLTASNNGPMCQEGQSLQLTANYTGSTNNYYWTGPNGYTSTLQNPSVSNFAASMAGTYTVSLPNGCTASTLVTYEPSPLPEITANYCTGNGTIQLTATSGFASYQWNTGTTGNPITVTQAGTYTVTVTNSNGCTSSAQINIQLPGNSVGGNLVANGDFEMGNTGFITNYILQGNGAFQQGKFAVTTNAGTPYGPNFTGVDHTTGNGKWMMVNGATASNKTVWQQTIPVTPNSAYNFSVWLTNMGTQNDPQILIFINGSPVTGLITLPDGPNNWQQYSATWNAAGNTTATIRIVNNRLENSGNDFGIDDISFTNANPVFASVGLSIVSTNPTCSNLSNGSANLTVTGAIPPYTYAWSNGATTEDVSNLAPGTYIATVTDNTGCTATASVTINAGPPFLPTAGNSGNVCPGGSLSLNASNGASYNWSGPNNFSSTDQNPIISNFPGAAYGTYAVTVTNTAGCIGTATTAVTPTCPAQALNFDGVDDLVNINPSLGNFGTGDFTVEMNVRTTRTGEYIIAKRPSCNFGNFWNVFIIGNGKVAIEVGQGPGNFNYTTFTSVSSVVDGQWHHIALSRNGTLISLYIDGVLENSANPSFVADLNNTAVLRLGYSPCTNVNGTLVYQGDMDEIRIWNRALCLGELQNNQNCTLGGLQTALLAQYSFNQGIAFGNNAGITTLLDGSGNGNNGTLQSFAVNGLISNWVAPGVGNGAPCSAFVAPVIVAGSNSPVCGGTDLNLTATAGTSYQWSGPNGFTSILQNPTLTNFSAAMVGTYAVIVTSGLGCAGTATVTVSGDAVTPTITCPADITVNCEPGLCGASVSYTMATGSDNCPNLTLVRALGLASGSFFPRGSNFVTFEAIDGAGNASNCEMGIHVMDNQAPVVTCPPSFTVNTTLGSCDAMVNFALPTATDNCPSPTVVQIAGNPAGATLGVGTYSYAFEAHDISANQGFCNFTVTVADQEAPTAICQNSNLQLVQGSATLSPSAIDNGSSDVCGAVTLSLGLSNFDCSLAGNNNVTLTVTDASGNTSSCVAVVNVVPGAMSVTTQVQTYNCGYGISCNGLSDGRAVVTPVGGCPPYSYLWDNGETGATATHLDHYNHNVTVTDGNGTVAGATVYVTEPPLLIFSLSSQTYACGHNLHCYGSHDGFIGSSLSGGCAPYTYSWTGPGGFHSSAPAFANLDAGYYTAVLTDANGCTETDDITLTEPAPLEVTICPDQNVTLGWQPEQCALIGTTTTGGCAPYSYLWSNNSTDAQPTVCPGITTQYSLNVTDANNCQVQADHWVTVVDVRCGQNLENVKMCSGSNQLMCVNPSNVAQRLLQGWTLGACGELGFESACGEPLNLGCTPTGDIAEICFKFRGVDGGTVSFYRNQGLTQLITTYSNVVAGSTVCISANGLPGNTFPNQIYAVVDNGSALQFDAGMGNIVIPQDYAELVLVTWTDVNGLTCNEDAPVPCPCSGNITSLSLTYVGAPVYMVRIWKDLNHTQLIATFTGVTTNQALIFPLNNVFKIFVEIVGSGVGDTRIETTCNTLEVGQRHGYFDVTAYLDGNGDACPAGHLRMAEASQPESAIQTIHLAAYPNPFQAATTLEFSVPTTQSVSLKLFSLTGVEIASLFEGNAEGGVVHKVDFKPVALAAGVYFCVLETRSGDRIYHKLLLQD